MNAKTLKKSALAAVILTLAFSAGGLLADERYEEKFARTESLDQNGKVSISNISGKVDVRTWNKAEVQIDAVKRSEASSMEKAKENAGLVNIEVIKEGNAVMIKTKYPEERIRRRGMNVSVSYVLTIPVTAALRVENMSGAVDVRGTAGSINIDVMSGAVRLADVSGSVECSTESGAITLGGGTGAVSLKTISGGIEAQNIKGSIEAETVSGGITLMNVREAKSVRAKTTSGGIECETDILPSGRYSFDVLSGSITLSLPPSANFDLDAEAFSGSIRTDFPVTVSGRVSPRELRGTIGSGGAVVRVKCFSGTIVIKKK